MKTKQTAKPSIKAKKITTRSSVQNLPVNERQTKAIKGGAARGRL